MNSTFKTVLIATLVAVIVAGGFWLVGNQSAPAVDVGAAGAGLTHFQSENFRQGAFFGQNGQSSFNNIGAFTSTADLRIKSPVRTGSVALGTNGTTTITAANVCDSPTITAAPSAVGSTTLPTALALAADCLTTNLDWIDVTFANIATTAASTTVLTVANASTTFRTASTGAATSTVTIAGNTMATLRFVRTAADTNTVLITNFKAP